MCVDHSIKCSCGKSQASFQLRDEILPIEAVANLYCPACSQRITYDPESMIADNGWIIGLNMEVARFMLRQKASSTSMLTPDFIFDEGYCTWRGITPSDHIDSLKEREALVRLASTDRTRYFQEIKTWGNNRMQRLAREGWRKAHEREPVKA